MQPRDDDLPPLVPLVVPVTRWSAPAHKIIDFRLCVPLARAVGLPGIYDIEDECELRARLALLGLDADRLIDACQRRSFVPEKF